MFNRPEEFRRVMPADRLPDRKHLLEVVRGIDDRRAMLEGVQSSVKVAKVGVRSVKSRSRIGRKLITAGILLTVGSPDPFTDIIGMPIVLAGVVADRVYSHIGIRDAYEEASKLLRELKG